MYSVVALAALVLVGCEHDNVVRQYCGADMEYTITKLNKGLELDLHIGHANPAICRAELVSHNREANLVADVTSVDEALKLVEENRQRYLSKDVAASK